MLSDEMISGLIGAIVGAAVAHILDSARERRNTRLTTQRSLVGEMVYLQAEMKAALTELDAFRRAVGEGQDPVRFADLQGRLLQLEGRATQVGILVMPTFKTTRVRAACDKLRSRFREARDLFLRNPQPSTCLRDIALRWLDTQTETFGRMAAEEAGIPLRYGGDGVMYVGWGKKANQRWMERWEELSAVDREPPWRPEVRLFLQGLTSESDEAKEMKAAMLRKISGVQCDKHERAAHVTLHGRKSLFDIQIEACCEEMMVRTRKAIDS